MSFPSAKIKKRMLLMFALFLTMLVGLVFRVGYWQIIKGDWLKAEAIQQQTRERTITANRGYIYDRNGKPLAKSVTVDTVACNPEEVKKSGAAEIVAAKLASILEMNYDDVYKSITKNTSYQIIKKRITPEQSQAIKDLKDSSKDKERKEQGNLAELSTNYSGIYFEEDSKRYYSYNIAPHVIGFTGYDNEGRQGIEMSFDKELTGRAGSIISAKSANGTSMDFQYEAQISSENGADVVLTIDETIQHFLEKHLENAVVDDKLKEGAAGIIMNPKTGEILAMATKPDFDLNSPYDISQFEKYQVLLDPQEEIGSEASAPLTDEQKIAEIRNKMWRNKAISDTYEPGSTFKIITAAAGLEENVVNLDSKFYCSGSVKVGSHTIHCHKVGGHGAETFVEGVQNSCNPVFIEIGLRLGAEKFMQYFKAFGLTERTGIDLVGEAKGVYHTGELSEVDVATSSFGQSFNVTPIQLITAVSAVINGGNLMKPQIVKEIRNDSGVIKSYQPEIRNRVISQETSDTMRKILESVVSSPTGTGKNAYIKGYRIGGKTGTSQKGARTGTKRIASFVGFAPADDPQIVCLIMLDEPQVANKYGGTIAAPVVGAIIEDTLEYLGVERQFTADELAQMSLTVPEVRGMAISDAEKNLKQSNLKAKVTGGGQTVVDQLPKPGASISASSTVILYTTQIQGENLVTVPNVVGLSMQETRARLEAAGLNFEVIGAGQNSSEGAYAAKQSIAAGEKVQPATVVGVEFRHSSSD
ncbi:MAG: penicillin-binding transpeptidase domain-containing protein [Clostridia bacterium]|nr:penicillin-binding transpeptidase domain-containing protein [Clostridia bacterium]